MALVAAGFRRYASYRQATLAGAFTNTVFGVIKISILFAAASAAGGTIAGYDRAALSTYTWVSQGLIAVVWVFAWTPVVDRVRSGDVAIDLGRPVHPVAAWLAGMIVNLLTDPGFYDVALRDFGLLLGALTLARLAWSYDTR